MPQRIEYPVEPHHIAVLGKPAPWRRCWTLRPLHRGRFSLFVQPEYVPANRWSYRIDLSFPDAHGPPERVEITIPEPVRRFHRWTWKLVEWPKDRFVDIHEPGRSERTPPDSELLFLQRPAMEGVFSLVADSGSEPHRLLAWSCNQPFDTSEEGHLIRHAVTDDAFEWYRKQTLAFDPHLVWGLGDTAYSDGTEASDFVNDYYDRPALLQSTEAKSELLHHYRHMYRNHWSFAGMQTAMRNFPHCFIWDDHEIRDGWGSEADDFSGRNTTIFHCARQAAEEYILNSGPRIRQLGHYAPTPLGGRRTSSKQHSPSQSGLNEDAHQAYIEGDVAAFIFDGRMSRKYNDPGGKVISQRQLKDFQAFCRRVAQQRNVRFLLLGNSVPFINLVEFLERLGSAAPKPLTDLLGGMRDDIRDGWHSPGNIGQLEQIISTLRHLHRQNGSLEMINISGDIHTANLFSFQPPGFTRALYQVTSSALTNRVFPPDWANEIIQVGSTAFSETLGVINRLWPTVSDPNLLLLEPVNNRLRLVLKVLDLDAQGEARGSLNSEKDLVYEVGKHRFSGQHLVMP